MTRVLAWVALALLVCGAASGSGCGPLETDGGDAPEAVDGGAWFPGEASLDDETDRQLATQLCQGECYLRRAAWCEDLDDAEEQEACVDACPTTVARLPARCLGRYVALRTCVAGSAPPVFVCEGPRPRQRRPETCTPQLLALTACRAGW